MQFPIKRHVGIDTLHAAHGIAAVVVIALLGGLARHPILIGFIAIAKDLAANAALILLRTPKRKPLLAQQDGGDEALTLSPTRRGIEGIHGEGQLGLILPDEGLSLVQRAAKRQCQLGRLRSIALGEVRVLHTLAPYLVFRVHAQHRRGELVIVGLRIVPVSLACIFRPLANREMGKEAVLDLAEVVPLPLLAGFGFEHTTDQGGDVLVFLPVGFASWNELHVWIGAGKSRKASAVVVLALLERWMDPTVIDVTEDLSVDKRIDKGVELSSIEDHSHERVVLILLQERLGDGGHARLHSAWNLNAFSFQSLVEAVRLGELSLRAGEMLQLLGPTLHFLDEAHA